MDDNRTEQAPEQKHRWQQTKENWYDKLNVTVRTLDIIIGLATIGLVIVFIRIFMDAGIIG